MAGGAAAESAVRTETSYRQRPAVASAREQWQAAEIASAGSLFHRRRTHPEAESTHEIYPGRKAGVPGGAQQARQNVAAGAQRIYL